MGDWKRGRTAAAAAVCIVVGAAAGPSMATGAGAIKDVLVKNTAAEPVPTQAVGTTPVGGTVTVGNAATSPVPVQVTNEASGGTPWQKEGIVVLADGAHLGTETLATVPAGKRLVVEFISANTPPTNAVSAVAVNVGDESIMLPMQRYNAASTGAAAVPVRAYADAGEDVRLYVRDNSGNGVRTSHFTVVGRLVDMP